MWQESLILVGGTSVTQAQGKQLFHEMSNQESADAYAVSPCLQRQIVKLPSMPKHQAM